jgi:hypothetical protein
MEFLTQPFALGFYTGLILLVIALYHHFKLKLEHARYKRMLSDKLEIEGQHPLQAEAGARWREKGERKPPYQGPDPERKRRLEENVRDLEIFARAEKKNDHRRAPVLPARGSKPSRPPTRRSPRRTPAKAAPKRFFQRFFGGGSSTDSVKALPQSESAKERAEAM